MPRLSVSASILCADFTRLGEEIRKTEEAGADMIHVDVMDGHFVPNITIGPVIVNAIRPLTRLPIEAHLMIENPGNYIEAFAEAGTDIISVHAECYGTRRASSRLPGQFPKEIDEIDPALVRKDISKIKSLGRRIFLTINPGTPMCLQPVLKDIDGILIMSVNPGFAKQAFMPEVLDKIRELRKIYSGDISIDGGINDKTAPQAVKAGANILVTASYFYGAKDRAQVVKILKAPAV